VKRAFAYGKDLDHNEVHQSLVDVLVFIGAILADQGDTVSDAMEVNIKKLEARYPTLAFSAECATNRNTATEKEAMLRAA
jgi:hypothetical protein